VVLGQLCKTNPILSTPESTQPSLQQSFTRKSVPARRGKTNPNEPNSINAIRTTQHEKQTQLVAAKPDQSQFSRNTPPRPLAGRCAVRHTNREPVESAKMAQRIASGRIERRPRKRVSIVAKGTYTGRIRTSAPTGTCFAYWFTYEDSKARDYC